MAKKNRFLGCEGLTPQEISLLQTMLNMVALRSHAVWQYAEFGPFDAIVSPDMRKDAPDIAVTAEMTEMNLGFHAPALFIRTNLPAVTLNGERRTNQNFIVCPIRPAQFIEKLLVVDELLETYDFQVDNEPEPRVEWADILMAHWGTKDNFIVKTAAYKAVVFMGPKRVMFDKNLQTLDEVIQADILTIRKIDRHRAKELLKNQASQSLRSIGWYAAHDYHKNRLCEKIDQSQLYCLKQWPDFGSLPYKPEYITLAGFLTNYDLTEGQLLEASKIDEAIVHRFMNACLLSGLLAPVDRKGFSAWLSRNENPLTTQRRSLFAKIRARFGL